MLYTLIFTPLEGDEEGFDFTIVDGVTFRTYERLGEKGFPIAELRDNTVLVGIFPNVGSRFDGLRGMFSKEIS